MNRPLDPKTTGAPARRAALACAGVPKDEMDRPRVLVLSACHPLNPAAAAQRGLRDAACLGAQSAGATPLAVDLAGAGSPAPFGDGHEWLDVAAVAFAAERAAAAVEPAALVLLADGDASLLALLRAALRLDLPCLALACGGAEAPGRFERLMELGAEYRLGRCSKEDFFDELEAEATLPGLMDAAYQPSTLRFLVEALGLTLPGASTAPGGPSLAGLARRSGWEAVAMANLGWRPSKALGASAWRNALALQASLGADPFAVWALAQAAGELGKPLEGGWVSQPDARCFLKPGLTVAQWHFDGGVPALLQRLWDGGSVDASAATGCRLSLKEALGDMALPAEPQGFEPAPGRAADRAVALLRGGEAALLMARPAGLARARKRALVFSEEAAAVERVLSSKAPGPDDCLVVATGGARLHSLAAALKAAGCAAWVVADGPVAGPAPEGLGLALPRAGGRAFSPADGGALVFDFERGAIEAPGAPAAPKPPQGRAAAEWDRLAALAPWGVGA